MNSFRAHTSLTDNQCTYGYQVFTWPDRRGATKINELLPRSCRDACLPNLIQDCPPIQKIGIVPRELRPLPHFCHCSEVAYLDQHLPHFTSSFSNLVPSYTERS